MIFDGVDLDGDLLTSEVNDGTTDDRNIGDINDSKCDEVVQNESNMGRGNELDGAIELPEETNNQEASVDTPPVEAEKASSAEDAAKEQFELQVKQAKEDLAELAVQLAELDAAKKATKEEYNEALDYLVALQRKGPVKAENVPVAAKVASDSPTGEPVSVPTEDDSWKQISTSEVLDGIEGMGTRKRSAIIDEFPTLGHLVAAQVEASTEFKPFKDKLPKGIGTEMASRIEEKIVDIMIKYSPDMKNGKIAVAKSDEATPPSDPDNGPTFDLRVEDAELEESDDDDEEIVSGDFGAVSEPEEFLSDDDLLEGL